MFDPGREQPTISFQLSDGTRHRTQSYNTWESSTSAFWASKPAQNYRNCRSWNDVELQLGTESKEDDDSGFCSPPLWTTSPPMSPQHRKNHYRSLSPASRTQAIARGQRELMEMVRNMPESSYELSLKDLVEHHHRIQAREENSVGEKILKGGNRKIDKKALMKRKGNIDSGGFYLKMGFPIFLGSNKKNNMKKKESSSANNNSSRISPRPSISDGSAKGVEKEWWKKSLPESQESDSGVSSINSGSMKSSGSSSSSSSSRSNSRHEKSASSCWPFIRRPQSLTQE